MKSRADLWSSPQLETKCSWCIAFVDHGFRWMLTAYLAKTWRGGHEASSLPLPYQSSVISFSEGTSHVSVPMGHPRACITWQFCGHHPFLLMYQESLLCIVGLDWPADLLLQPAAAVVTVETPLQRVLFRGLRVRVGIHTGVPEQIVVSAPVDPCPCMTLYHFSYGARGQSRLEICPPMQQPHSAVKSS